MGKNRKIQKILRVGIIFLLVYCLKIFPDEKSVYTIQVISLPEKSLSEIMNKAKEIEKKGFENVRVEKIGKYVVLRVGLFENYEKGKKVYEKMKKYYPDCFLRKAYYIEERIIYPVLEKKEKISVSTAEKEIQKESIQKQEKTTFEGKIKRRKKFLFILSFVIFLFLLFLPLLPAIVEIKKPKDNKPLFINMEYTKNPRYFDQSFRNLLLNALKETNFVPSIYHVKLSKDEKVEITENMHIKRGQEINHILFVKGDLYTGENVILNKEVYVKGKVQLGKNNILRGLTSENDIILSDNVRVVRWIASDKNIFVGKNCNLGVSACADKIIKISGNCKFKRLYGHPVIMEKLEEKQSEKAVTEKEEEKKERKLMEISDSVILFTKNWSVISPNSKIEKNIIAKSSLIIRENSEIYGDIKVYGKLIIENGVKIFGNVFCESEIEVKEDCFISENVFSQESIFIHNNVVIGQQGKIKSVIANNKIIIGRNVSIYGFVLVEGDGKIT